ncbi:MULTISPECIES: SMI1/KNR4 family protein [unclassified Vibrio]|uniref:SMI1/KNR4 family protein n=1 Tax=unclassified Vibrio TaxID=2614977 RepID=UPI000B8EA26F|nr:MULTISPECIES: SMI1/KNR4 family protein [unclassified Vibrio]NAX43224.1 SMI1/KNR4 family protein [Vibrio sp. V25_P4S6T154]OXX49129.1 SMI1/KNR4 family protein [Vibrio sp. V17_P4S1T151]OXX62399.1 SMI1/KNR4 family protein [Vibrio sp. V15_P4S5T153]
MNEISFIYFLPPATDDEILNLERVSGSKLPEEMKSIYKKYNGGQPQPSFVHDDKNLYPINSFYSISEIIESFNDFEDESLPIGFSRYEMLPFAYDPGSGIYSISLRKNDFGTVYFYVLHEEAEIFGVWRSFKSFVESIVDDPESL